MRSKAEIYEEESPQRAWKLNALRARIDSEVVCTSSGELISLQEIMLASNVFDEDSEVAIEAYTMLDSGIDDKEDNDSTFEDRTLIVKRANLQFNNKSCVVISFEDISAVKKLK